MTRHSGTTYEGIAGKYAASVDSRPWNAHYERPAVISLLPKLENAKVLDAGCGSGWYAEYLLNHGASVTAFDLNREFVALTQARVGDRARVLHADLSRSLDFAGTGEFDLVICPLVLHYLEDWLPALREFHRVLRSDGVLVFSTHHPAFYDFTLSKLGTYFATELVEDEWDWLGKVHFYRRPLTTICSDLRSAGFLIDVLLEPLPTEEFRKANPEGFEKLTKVPGFLIFRAQKSQPHS